MVGDGLGEEGKVEELEFFMDEVELLKEVPGEGDLEEAGEEECKEEGGFGAADVRQSTPNTKERPAA